MILGDILKNMLHMLMAKKRNTYLMNLNAKGMYLGSNVTIVDDFFIDPSHCYLIAIGDNCTICPHVRFIAHDAEH